MKLMKTENSNGGNFTKDNMKDEFKTLTEAYKSIYENVHDLAKQDPREAYPHKDDMKRFEDETEEDLYDDEEENEDADCPCRGDVSKCNCTGEDIG